MVNREHHFYDLMTKVQLVTLYGYSSSDLTQDPEYLKQQKAIPAAYIMDNNLMRGIYPLIGHLPVTAEELNFPMHYGKYSSSTRPGYYFGWGMVMASDLPKIQFEDNDMVHDYRNNGVGSGAPVGILELLRKGLPPHYVYTDIGHPENIDLKIAIFKSMGIDPSIDYDACCKKMNVPDRRVLLQLINR